MTSSKWSEMCHSISPEMQPRGWSESGSSDADLFMEHCPKNVPITHVDCSPMDYLPGVQSNLPHCQPQKDLEKSHSSLMWLKSSIFPGRNIICIPIKYCVPTIKSLEDGIHLISKVLNYVQVGSLEKKKLLMMKEHAKVQPWIAIRTHLFSFRSKVVSHRFLTWI